MLIQQENTPSHFVIKETDFVIFLFRSIYVLFHFLGSLKIFMLYPSCIPSRSRLYKHKDI
jgi:hypothetical protein